MKLLQYSVLSVLGSTLLLSNGAVAALRGASSDAEDEDVAATSYRPVNIKNLTPYRATGVVSYASGPFKCSDDSYEVKPRPGEWTGPSRGICLVHQITATLHDVTGCDGDVQAKVTVQRERPMTNLWLSRWASANSRQPVLRTVPWRRLVTTKTPRPWLLRPMLG